jgi:hypothetical protein
MRGHPVRFGVSSTPHLDNNVRRPQGRASMAKPNNPTLSPSPIPADSTAPRSRRRDQVRQLMLKMAPVALAAAAALTNAACPQETSSPAHCNGLSDSACDRCGQGPGPGTPWAEGSVAWGSYGGETIVRLQIIPAVQVHLPDAYTLVGGTLLPSPAGSSEMMIKPDAGATRIRLAGALTCESKPFPFTATVYLVAPDYYPTAQIPYVEVYPL